MENTSALVINSTSDPFSYSVCSQGRYMGLIVGNIAMLLRVFVGTPAYCWLLWFYVHAGWKIKPTQVFLLNLTILELTFSIQCALQTLNGLIFDKVVFWKLSFIVFGLTWVGRPLLQVCVCVEQYLAVIYPIMFLKYKGAQYRVALAAVVWLMASGFAVRGAYVSIFPDTVFNSVFFLAMIVISFCCVSVLRALKHPGPGDTQIPKERAADVGNQQKRKAFNKIFSGLLIISFAYLPQVICSLFDVIQISMVMFYCNIIPFMSAFILCVMVTPLQKIYKNGRKKILQHLERMNKNLYIVSHF